MASINQSRFSVKSASLQESAKTYTMPSAHSSVTSFDKLLESEKKKGKAYRGSKDMETQPKLKLFESPLAHGRRGSAIPSPVKPTFINISGPTELAGLPLKDSIYNEKDDEEIRKDRLDDANLRETPEFKRYEEATNIELFYDLFFVANLTTFTDAHDINEVAALKAFAGFFCLLWFLWAQVSLFDVRFVQDSILERIGKACQFGVMVGLAIVGPAFDPAKQEQGVFQTLALILMASRIVLGFQYMVVLREVWYYKNSKMPLAILVAANFVAALIYLGTFFGFKPDTPQSNVYVVWYITAILETIVNIAVSSKWKVLTFAGTHLIKRMSLLTLIILGEGIIALSKSIAKITEHEDALTVPLIGTIASGVIIIYFIYMAYFDWMNRSHFGSLREGLWTFLHFPFHLGLVLLVEGVAQFILWRKIVEVVKSVNNQFTVAEEGFNSTSSSELSELFSNVTNIVFEKFNPEFTRTYTDAQKAVYGIGNSTFNSTEQLREITTLFAVIQDSLFESFGIEAPETTMETTGSIDPNDEWRKNMDAFVLIFVYFFIAAGATLLLMTALKFVSTRKTKADYISITINTIVGVVLCSLAGIVNTESGFEFAQSAWILPTVALSFVFVMSLGYTKLL